MPHTTAFAEQLLREGTIEDTLKTQSDNGEVELIAVRHSNGIGFLVWKLNGEIKQCNALSGRKVA